MPVEIGPPSAGEENITPSPNRERDRPIAEGVVIIIGIVGVRRIAGDIDRRAIEGAVPHDSKSHIGSRPTQR